MAQQAPFRMGTRQRRQKQGALAYAANSTVTQQFFRVGYLSRVFVQFRGTATLSGAGALSDLGPWNIVQRFRLSTNIGAATIIDATAYGAFLQQRQQNEGQDFSQAGIGQTVPNADIHAAPVAMGANTWAVSWILPIGVNVGKEFDYGLLNAQSPETTISLDVLTGALTDAAALITGIVGNFHVYAEYFEVPQPDQYAQPPLALCRTLEEFTPIGAQNAETVYTIPRMGVMLQNIYYVQLNNVRADGFDYHAIRLNKTDTAYLQERQWSRMIERAKNALNPITGVAETDLFYAGNGVGQGDTRDAIDTEELTTVELAVYISGALGGAGTNKLNVVRRILQRLDRA